MQYTKNRAGDFAFSTVVGTFDFDLADLEPQDLLHGMPLQSQYIYGGFQVEDGPLYVIERKFVSPMTGGGWWMSSESGNMELLPTAINTARGELVRDFTPDTRRWTDHLMHKVGKENAPDAEAFELYVDNDRMEWSEGSLVSMEGERFAKAVSFFAPMRDEPLLYISVPYMMKGEIQGRPAEGAIFFDHLYFAHGIEWKEYAWYTDVQVSWNVFYNQFDDGSYEWGHIVKGTEDFAAAMVVDTRDGEATSSTFEPTYRLDDTDCVAGAEYDLGDERVWDFTCDEDGRMLQFNKARWSGYRAQGGRTRRRGDDRTVVNGWTWLECFADRIREGGWAK